ncbi:Lacal_2735 family protein [Flavobacteriales bacterium]|nr:Lacal_2735 family protein [Flavobacteriales bacterium]
MFGMFKKDPVEKLRKEHARLLAEAHRLSTVDRTKSDQMTAKAAEIEAELVALTQKGGA